MNLLLQVGYSAASILWARTPPGRWDKNISIRVVFSCPRQLNKWAWKWNVFYFTGNGYWMGWNTLCLSTYCINEVIWALIFPKMRKNKYLSPFTSLKSPFYFLEAVVGALPVAHEPSSFSFSLLLLSFTLVALSLVALDFALCLTKDRGGQCSLSFNIVLTQDGRITIHH